MARDFRSGLAVLYAVIVAAGLTGGVALATSSGCKACSTVDLSGCTATGVFDPATCCMPANGGNDCFNCQRQEYLCTAHSYLGPPVNCVDSGIACN